MFRRLLNNVIESVAQLPQETVFYPNPFVHPDTYHFGWLTSAAPCFPVNSKNIRILSEPQEFYEELIQKCVQATKRVTLVSLYLGNGQLEKNIIDTLLNNQSYKNGELKVEVLLDYTRGSRFVDNSRTVLKPLLQNAESNCNISLYHTPLLRGITKKFAPNRWNEVFGLQHMKLYIFDDTLIISGANLSNDYFTNRQDRYFVITDKRLCDFYSGLVSKVQDFSLKMDKSDNVSLKAGWNQLPYEGSKEAFVQKAGDLIENYLLEARDERNTHKEKGHDTWVFPLVQMGQLGIEQDAQVTDRLFYEAPKGTRLNIATGYFNLTSQYMNTIINYSVVQCNFLMAHPEANGFMGAKGMAGGIPDAYSLIAQRFNSYQEKLGQTNRIKMHEYLRKGWTYHAKGLWYYGPNNQYPILTLIGSPNFGERSVKRDLETQLAIVTENKDFQKRLHKECTELYKLGLPAEKNRVIPKWVYAMVFLFRNFF